MSRVGAGVQLRQPRVDAGQRRTQVVQPRSGGTELVAVLVVVPLKPARPDAQDQPAAADVIDGAGHVGDQFGLRYELQVTSAPISIRDVCSAHAPSIVQHSEVRTVLTAVQRIEVIPVERDVGAQILGAAHRIPDQRA